MTIAGLGASAAAAPATAGDAGAMSAAQKAKLADGARQFEAMLVGEMFKGLKFGSAAGEDTDEDEVAGANGTVQGFATDALGKAIAAGKGLGIASEIVRQVTAEREARNGGGGGTKV